MILSMQLPARRGSAGGNKKGCLSEPSCNIMTQMFSRSVGLMDKASASGAGDSGFKSWADHCPYLGRALSPSVCIFRLYVSLAIPPAVSPYPCWSLSSSVSQSISLYCSLSFSLSLSLSFSFSLSLSPRSVSLKLFFPLHSFPVLPFSRLSPFLSLLDPVPYALPFLPSPRRGESSVTHPSTLISSLLSPPFPLSPPPSSLPPPASSSPPFPTLIS